MSELFSKICANSTHNKNVSSIIIGYLTDPPKLPFINELHRATQSMLNDDLFWNYAHYFVDKSDSTKNYGKQKIYRNKHNSWYPIGL